MCADGDDSGVAHYRLSALAAVAVTALLGVGAIALLVAGGLSGPTLAVVGVVVAFVLVLVLAGLGIGGARRTSTPYW